MLRNPFDYMEERGVTVPMLATAAINRRTVGSYYGDEKQFGKKLTPLEEEARHEHNSWGSLGYRWVDDILNCCRELKLDGIIQWCQVGCPTTLGLTKVVSDRAENELGILTLNLEGRMIYPAAYDRLGDQAKLGEFIDICLARKGLS